MIMRFSKAVTNEPDNLEWPIWVQAFEEYLTVSTEAKKEDTQSSKLSIFWLLPLAEER